MPAISVFFVVFLLVQALLAVVAHWLASRRGDAADALSVLVFAGGILAAFVLGSVLVVLVLECLGLGLYALISTPKRAARRPSRR